MALAEARRCQATRICRIRLRIGELAGVVPEALTFAFDLLREGTLARDAVLEIETVPLSCYCEACQKKFKPVLPSRRCTLCGHANGAVRGGRELELQAIEVE